MKKLMIIGIMLGFTALNSQAQLSPEKVKHAKDVSKESKPAKKNKPVKKEIKKAPSKTIYREKLVKTNKM